MAARFCYPAHGQAAHHGFGEGIGPLNELLAGDTSYPVVEAAGGRQRWAAAGPPQGGPQIELLRPIAEAAADLVCSVDFRLIRACEGFPCTLVFLDRTKAHLRRWCSMAVCGNRAKAAGATEQKSAASERLYPVYSPTGFGPDSTRVIGPGLQLMKGILGFPSTRGRGGSL